MYNVTQTFIDNSQKLGRQISARISFDDIILTGEDIYRINKEYNGDFYRSVMQQLEGEIKGRYDLTGKVLKVEVGISYDNSPFEYVDYGFFIVKEHERIVGSSSENDRTTFKAYDGLLNSHTLYDVTELEITYPISVFDLYQAIANHIGLQISETSIVNGDKLINEDKWTNIENVTYRNILDEISATSGSSIMIHNNKLLAKYVDTSINVDEIPNSMKVYENNVRSLTIGEYYGNVNMLNLTREQAHDNYVLPTNWEDIPVNDRKEIVIADNQIMDKERSEYAPNLYNSILGLGYYPFESSAYGVIHLEPLDVVNVIDMNGVSHLSVVTVSNLTFSTGIKEDISSTIPGKAKEKYALVTDNARQFMRVYFLVDQQNGIIQGLIEQQDIQGEKITDLTLTVDGLSSEVTNITTNNLLPNINGFMNYEQWSFEQDGLLPDNNLYPDDNLYPMSEDSPIFWVVDTDTEAEKGLMFDFYGTAIYEKIPLIDTKVDYFLRLKSKGAGKLQYQVRQFNDDTLLSTNNLFTVNSSGYWTTNTGSFTPNENCTHIQLIIVSTLGYYETTTHTNAMFTRRIAKDYAKDVNDSFNYAKSSFTQLANQIVLSVDADGNMVEVELGANRNDGSFFNVKADNINLEGYTTINDGFKVLPNGDVEMVNAYVEGEIVAEKGVIGNFTLENGVLEYTTEEYDRVYTESDLSLIKSVMMGKYTPNDYQKYFLDVNGDDIIGIRDLAAIKSYLNGTWEIHKKIKSQIIIGTTDGTITTRILYEDDKIGDSFIIQGERIMGERGDFTSMSTKTMSFDGMEVYNDGGTLKVRSF